MNLQFETFETTEGYAKKLDQEDILSPFRDRFYLPTQGIYMDGNSLGLLSKDSEATLLRVLNEYKYQGINGWMESEVPWFHYGEELGNLQAPFVGALEGEVVVHGSTTVNLHLLLSTFFKPHQGRNKILIDELNFPSDKYAVESQLLLHNLDPATHLKVVKSRDGRMIEEEDIIAAMEEDIAIILLPSVLYRSGQLLDIERLTIEAHKRGILIGFDCCHSVGAIPHKLHQWGVDFAFWCNYKYMNNGPGGTASLFVHENHFTRTPGLWGWWGYRKDKQFDMTLDFQPASNAGGWQISTVSIFSAAPLEGSLKIFHEAGIDALREKSLLLTEYMIYLIDELLSPYNFSIGSPRDSHRRGGHVALEHPTEAIRINEALKKRGVVPDFRGPNVIRLAPMALYNTFHDVWQVVQHIKAIMEDKEYESFPKGRNVVA